MKTILVINGVLDDPSLLEQANAIRENEGGEVRLVRGYTVEDLESAILNEAKRNTSSLVVLWESSIRRDVEAEYGDLFESVEVIDRQFVLREGDAAPATPTSAAPQQTQKPIERAPQKDSVIVVNPYNAPVKGTFAGFVAFVKSVLAVKNAAPNAYVSIVDMPVTDAYWMAYGAVPIIKKGFNVSDSQFEGTYGDSFCFSDYSTIATFMEKNGVKDFVVVGPPGMPGTNVSRFVTYGQPFRLGQLSLPAITGSANPGLSSQAFDAGKAILKDIEGLSTKKTDEEKQKLIQVSEDAVKKYLSPKSLSRSTFLAVEVLGMVKHYLTNEWKSYSGKKQSEVDSDLAKRLVALGAALGINSDLEAANTAIAAAAGFSPKDIKNAVEAFKGKSKGRVTTTKDTKKTNKNTVEYVVSHPAWAKFESCFDDNIGVKA